MTNRLTQRLYVDSFAPVRSVSPRRPPPACPAPIDPALLVVPMYSRLIAPLLCASALAFACGPFSHSQELEPTPAHAAVDTAGKAVVAALDVRVGSTVELALGVTNAADHRVELRFPRGQTHDLAILDASGREVWRWSAGRMFTQAVQTKLLGTGETTSYAEQWTPPESGTYTVVATLTSDNYPVELRQGFTVP